MATQDGFGAAFTEGFVEADGFRIRYMAAGEGTPLIHLHGAGGMRMTRAHDLLSQHYRVIAFEMPGFGRSSENTRTATMADLAATMAAAITRAWHRPLQSAGHVVRRQGGAVAGGAAAGAGARHWCWKRRRRSVRIGQTPPSGSPEEIARLLYRPPGAARAVAGRRIRRSQAKTRALRDRACADRTAMPRWKRDARHGDTDAGVVRHARPLMPPEMGRHYKELMPNCHLVFVYDAGHAISTERPEAFAEVTLDFLERHEAFVINRVGTLIHP